MKEEEKNKKKISWVIWLILGVLIMVNAIEVGEYTHDCNSGEIIIVNNNSVWVCGNETSNNVIYGDINITGNITGNFYYGGMYFFNESGYSFNFAVQDKYYNFTSMTCGKLNGFSCDGANGKLTALKGSTYRVAYTAVGKGQNTHVYVTGVAVNGVLLTNTLSLTQTDSQVYKKMAGLGHITLNKGDVLTLQIKDSTGTGIGTQYEANLILEYIGE